MNRVERGVDGKRGRIKKEKEKVGLRGNALSMGKKRFEWKREGEP